MPEAQALGVAIRMAAHLPARGATGEGGRAEDGLEALASLLHGGARPLFIRAGGVADPVGAIVGEYPGLEAVCLYGPHLVRARAADIAGREQRSRQQRAQSVAFHLRDAG